jgi:hypothetical protein
MIAPGFEPGTRGLKDRCSTRLSYAILTARLTAALTAGTLALRWSPWRLAKYQIDQSTGRRVYRHCFEGRSPLESPREKARAPLRACEVDLCGLRARPSWAFDALG